jgi:hypothetical protein
MKKSKVSNPHKSPTPPQLPKFVEAVLSEIRYVFFLPIEQTSHRNQINYQLY